MCFHLRAPQASRQAISVCTHSGSPLRRSSLARIMHEEPGSGTPYREALENRSTHFCTNPTGINHKVRCLTAQQLECLLAPGLTRDDSRRGCSKNESTFGLTELWQGARTRARLRGAPHTLRQGLSQ
jgi:hypothetical protein